MLDLKVYVTSWRRYNECEAGLGWFDLRDYGDIAEFKKDLKNKGLIDGYDEELVIHDFDDYSGIGFYDLLGECHPFTVYELYDKLNDLEDEEIAIFKALMENYSNDEALDMLDDGFDGLYAYYSNMDDYIIEKINEMMEISEELKDFIDYKALIRYHMLDDNVCEVEHNGTIYTIEDNR